MLIMDPTITLAWAMPVNHVQLAPRLLSYTASKAAVTVLRLGAQKVASKPLGRLPPEIVEMIADNIRDNEYDRRIGTWTKAQKCIANTCSPSHHYSRAELSDIDPLMCHCCGSPVGIEESLDQDETDRRHEKAQTTYIKNFDDPELSKCRKVPQTLSIRVLPQSLTRRTDLYT